MSKAKSNQFRPVGEPLVLDGAYSDDQHARLLQAVRDNGPWKLILAQHFASVEELIATMSGAMPEGVTPTLDMFLTPAFRGFFAEQGVCKHPELEDCFYNSDFMARTRAYWNAEYVRPEQLMFNIQGPADNLDPGHLDAVTFRGTHGRSTPIWLMNIMGKSGLFQDWLLKKAQVITWFYKGGIGGGFTYWPDGPHGQPKRIAAPMWNRAVVVQNEMMYHRGEPNGPDEMRRPDGLDLHSLIEADPDEATGWRIRNDDKVIQHIPEQEIRFLVHWGAEVYEDLDEMKKVMDHTDDLDTQRIVDIFIQDLKQRGIKCTEPADPLHDQAFIMQLVDVYDIGAPSIYPPEAPSPLQAA
ncbi:MAG: hypothetical protein HKN19_04870 [Halioglobus sp.]|nr:hypothetical protein [Halioglobus sp.]